MDMVGKRVKHTGKYGEGTIVTKDDNFVVVKFDNELEVRKFPYPSSLGTFLVVLNEQSAQPLSVGSQMQNNNMFEGNQPKQKSTESSMNAQKDSDVKNSASITTQERFLKWLYDGNAKEYSPEQIVSNIAWVSDYVVRKRFTLVGFWDITDPKVFEPIYRRLSNAATLRLTNKDVYKSFLVAGPLYMKFLKEKPHDRKSYSSSSNTLISSANYFYLDDEHLVQSIKNLTVKDAVVQVLSDDSKAMTSDEIYSKIIEKGLYSFGAQNPINVVRTTIEYACDNSTYTHKESTPIFHFERNSDGKKVYSILSGKQNKETTAQVPTTYEFSSPHRYDVVIWSSNLEQEFQSWLEIEGYATRTAGVYRRAAAQVFRGFPALAEQAVVSAKTELDAIREFIFLLNADSCYVKTNAARHNQFRAALAALERFFSTNVVITYDKSDVLMNMEPMVPSNQSSSLGSIVDLEEGKAGIREILEAHFQTLYGYSNLNILWNAAQDNLALFLNDNAINSADDLWRFIYRAFLGEYVMSSPHIWKKQPNYPQSYVGVIVNLARAFGGIIGREQIDEYFSRIKQRPLINRLIIQQGLLMFFAPKRFILTELVNPTNERCQEIRKSLDKLFEKEKVPYIILRDIADEWFSTLPTITGNLNWTALLLQEILRLHPTVGYRTVLSGLDGQTLDTLGAAVVHSTSEINSFADVVHRYCYEREFLGKRMLSEDLRIILRDAGMLEGNELVYNLHKSLRDYRFAFTDENKMVKILER